MDFGGGKDVHEAGPIPTITAIDTSLDQANDGVNIHAVDIMQRGGWDDCERIGGHRLTHVGTVDLLGRGIHRRRRRRGRHDRSRGTRRRGRMGHGRVCAGGQRSGQQCGMARGISLLNGVRRGWTGPRRNAKERGEIVDRRWFGITLMVTLGGRPAQAAQITGGTMIW